MAAGAACTGTVCGPSSVLPVAGSRSRSSYHGGRQGGVVLLASLSSSSSSWAAASSREINSSSSGGLMQGPRRHSSASSPTSSMFARSSILCCISGGLQATAGMGGVPHSNSRKVVCEVAVQFGDPHSQMRCRGSPPARKMSIARSSNSRNVILSMDTDDLQAKRARDLKNIEDYMPDLDELDKDELQAFLELELESSLDLETFRHYEIMFLINEKNADEVQAVIKKVQDFIAENKGLIHRLSDWGMRSLAYKIKKATKANYVLMNIEIDSQAINKLNTLFEKDERVIRHMCMSQKTAVIQESIAPEEYRSSRVAEEEEEEEEEEEDYYSEDEEEELGKEQAELVLQRE